MEDLFSGKGIFYTHAVYIELLSYCKLILSQSSIWILQYPKSQSTQTLKFYQIWNFRYT